MNIITLISASEILQKAAAIWGKAYPIIIAVLFFGLLIFFHELGHFTFAKLFKVKVREFAMYGTCTLQIQKHPGFWPGFGNRRRASLPKIR